MNRIVYWDEKLFLYLNQLGSSSFDKFWLFLTDEYYWIPVYIILIIIIFEKFGLKKSFIILITIGLMIASTDNIASLFKYWVQRPRPCRNPELDGLFRLVIENCKGNYCFFSAHAASTFALAIYLSKLFYKKHKYTPYLFFLWAILVSYSRIYVGVHFPLDIITGAIFGLLIGWFYNKILTYIFTKYRLN